MAHSFFIPGSYKAPLSMDIQKEYNKLVSKVICLPPQLLEEKAFNFSGGKASARDIVAYQIGWGKLLLGWYQSGLEGTLPQMPGEGFTKWEYTKIARHFYQRYHYAGLEEQLAVFKSTVEQSIALAEHEYQTGNLDALDVWSWCTLPAGKKWPLSKWIRVNTAAPYKRAAAELTSLL